MKIPIPLHDNIDGIDIHSIIDRLAKVRGFQPVRLHYEEIRWLCAKAQEIFLSQPMMLELEAPIKVSSRLE